MTPFLKIIGCRAGSPSEGIAASGYLLDLGEQTILVDCGPGVVMGLNKEDLERLSAVIITHRHADHCIDLLSLSFNLLFPDKKPAIPLYGPPSLGQTIQLLDSGFGIESLELLRYPLASAFHFTPVTPGEDFKINNLSIHTQPSRHPVDTLSLRFEELGLVYPSDGAFTAELVQLAHKALVLLVEATYLDSNGHDLEGHGHLTAPQAGRLAALAGVNHLVLTHFSDYHQVREIERLTSLEFSGKTSTASPGLIIPL